MIVSETTQTVVVKNIYGQNVLCARHIDGNRFAIWDMARAQAHQPFYVDFEDIQEFVWLVLTPTTESKQTNEFHVWSEIQGIEQRKTICLSYLSQVCIKIDLANQKHGDLIQFLNDIEKLIKAAGQKAGE